MQLQVQLWPLPQMEKVDQSCCSGGGNDNEWPHSTHIDEQKKHLLNIMSQTTTTHTHLFESTIIEMDSIYVSAVVVVVAYGANKQKSTHTHTHLDPFTIEI